MPSNVSNIIARLRDPDYASPMQHLRDWADLDRLHAEAAEAMERLVGRNEGDGSATQLSLGHADGQGTSGAWFETVSHMR